MQSIVKLLCGFGQIVLASAAQTDFYLLWFLFLKASLLMKGFTLGMEVRTILSWCRRLARVMMKSFAFHIRSFHSSILPEWSDSPNAERFTFPLWYFWTQKKKRQVWATNGALSGKRGLVLWEINWSDLPLDVWARSRNPCHLLFSFYWPQFALGMHAMNYIYMRFGCSEYPRP